MADSSLEILQKDWADKNGSKIIQMDKKSMKLMVSV